MTAVVKQDYEIGNVAPLEPPPADDVVGSVRRIGSEWEEIGWDEALDMAADGLRAVVLCSQGSAFCAGADFNTPGGPSRDVYPEAARLFATRKPVVGAIQGPAIGGGLGLAVVAENRHEVPSVREV